VVPLAVIAARASTPISPGSAGRNFFESAEALVIQKAAQLAAAARVLKLAQPTAFIRPSTARALATDGGHLPLLTNTKLTALLLQVVPLSERKMSNWSETKLFLKLRGRTTPASEAIQRSLTDCLPEIETILRSGGTSPIRFTLHDSDHSFRVAQMMASLPQAIQNSRLRSARSTGFKLS
jgi:hypothetical protein